MRMSCRVLGMFAAPCKSLWTRRLGSLHRPCISSASMVSSLSLTQRCSIFTNKKRSFDRHHYSKNGEEKAEANDRTNTEKGRDASGEHARTSCDDDDAPQLFDKKIESVNDIPSAREMESSLPSVKQLDEELLSASELRRAIANGQIDEYTVPGFDKDDDIVEDEFIDPGDGD